jgi:hypothetical protein
MRGESKIDPDSSVVYLAMSMLCARQSSLVPELLYLLSPKQIIDFIKIYGGETIKVPHPEEFSKDLLSALACYHVYVENKSWDWFGLKYRVDGHSIRALQNRLELWIKGLSPGELNFIRSLKTHDTAQKMHEEVLS